MTDMRKLLAEAIGTAWLVIGGCGTAILTGGEAGGLLGISLAFGLTVLTMAYAIGHISGCHLNPAVSIGLFMAKRFDGKDLGPYIAAQIVGKKGRVIGVDFDPEMLGLARKYRRDMAKTLGHDVVEFHRGRIHQKLGVASMAELFRLCFAREPGAPGSR